jgi:hypothetical protein
MFSIEYLFISFGFKCTTENCYTTLQIYEYIFTPEKNTEILNFYLNVLFYINSQKDTFWFYSV